MGVGGGGGGLGGVGGGGGGVVLGGGGCPATETVASNNNNHHGPKCTETEVAVLGVFELLQKDSALYSLRLRFAFLASGL